MQEQTHKINKEWKTVTFSKGRKKNIKSEILESSTKAGINVNIFYTSTGKFLSSQTLSYKARPKTTNLHINMNEKNYTTEEQPQHKINFQTKNHFSALMEEDMVLNKTIYQLIGKTKEKIITNNVLQNNDIPNGHVSRITEDTPNHLQTNPPNDISNSSPKYAHNTKEPITHNNNFMHSSNDNSYLSTLQTIMPQMANDMGHVSPAQSTIFPNKTILYPSQTACKRKLLSLQKIL